MPDRIGNIGKDGAIVRRDFATDAGWINAVAYWMGLGWRIKWHGWGRFVMEKR